MPQAESYQGINRPGNNTGVGTTFFQADVNGVQAVSPTKLKQDNNIVHDKVMVNVPLAAATVSAFQHVVREGRWQLDGATVYFQTGSTSGS